VRNSTFSQLTCYSAVTEEAQVRDDVVVKCTILRVLAVKQKKRVDEKRQVIDQRDVKRAVVIKYCRRYVKDIREVDLVNRGSHCCWPEACRSQSSSGRRTHSASM
jgi:hypothetical protein